MRKRRLHEIPKLPGVGAKGPGEVAAVEAAEVGEGLRPGLPAVEAEPGVALGGGERHGRVRVGHGRHVGVGLLLQKEKSWVKVIQLVSLLASFNFLKVSSFSDPDRVGFQD